MPEKWSSASVYFHIRTVRSRPADATRDADKNLADLAVALWPPKLPEGDVAITFPELFHILNRPS